MLRHHIPDATRGDAILNLADPSSTMRNTDPKTTTKILIYGEKQISVPLLATVRMHQSRMLAAQ
jgi:hypothetical protein